MARGGGSWRHGAVLWGGLFGFAAVLAVVGAALGTRGGLQTAANVAQLVSVVLAIPALAVPLWLWARRASAPTALTSQDVGEAKDVLAGLMAVQWRAEATLRSLDDPDPIPVHWNVTGNQDAMDLPENLTASSLLLTASSDDIKALVQEFRAMRRRRLVIIGGPGAGKTTLAVQLVRELLATRSPDEPVPVLLSVADWDTGRFPRLQEWITFRLVQDYPALRARQFSPEIPKELAKRGQLLPVLDGLDELPGPAQAAVIKALNRSLGDDEHLIITSRTAEYITAVTRAGDVLTSAVVIEPEPVSRTAAADYLRRTLPRNPSPEWERTLAVLGGPGPANGSAAALAQVTSTPLGLWLLRTVYTPREDPTVLLDPVALPDPAAVQAHLFDQLIPTLISIRAPTEDRADLFRPRRRHDPDAVRYWLGYLAHHLTIPRNPDDSPRTRDLAWWRLARETRAPTRRVLGVLAATATTITLGLAVGLTDGSTAGLLYGIVFGIVVGAVISSNAKSWERDQPGFANLRARGRVGEFVEELIQGVMGGVTVGLATGFVFGLAFGLPYGLVIGFVPGIWFGAAFGVAFALFEGLAFGLISWVEAPTSEELASTPLANWQADRAVNLLRVTLAGLAGAAAGGAAGAVIDRPAAGIIFGLSSGIATGLVRGDHRAWWAYIVATSRLATAKRLPRRLMPFLDDAHRLGLLRSVGPLYQFRHAELQDHLAATYAPDNL